MPSTPGSYREDLAADDSVGVQAPPAPTRAQVLAFEAERAAEAAGTASWAPVAAGVAALLIGVVLWRRLRRLTRRV